MDAFVARLLLPRSREARAYLDRLELFMSDSSPEPSNPAEAGLADELTESRLPHPSR